MGRSKSASWSIGTVALCVLLLAGSWFLLIAPGLAAAAQTRTEAEQIAQQNGELQARTVELREQFADIDRYRAELAELQTQIPTDARTIDLLREIDAAAASAEVTITSAGAGDALPVAAPAQVAPTETTAQDAAAPATAEEPAAAPAAVDGFVAVPLNLTVVGPAPNVTRFMADLQTRLERLVLVDTLTGTAQPAAEAAEGRPATAVGDLEVALTGYAYVLLDPSVASAPADEPTARELPEAPGDKNPFAPNTTATPAG